MYVCAHFFGESCDLLCFDVVCVFLCPADPVGLHLYLLIFLRTPSMMSAVMSYLILHASSNQSKHLNV